MSIQQLVGHTTDKRIRNLTIVLVFGNLVYHLFPFPPILWRLSLVAMSVLCYFSNNKKSNLEKAIFVFIVIDLFYFLLSLAYTRPSMTTIGDTISGFSTLYIFSYLTRREVVTEKFIITAAIILFVGCLVYYWHYQMSYLERLGKGEDDAVTINASNVFLYLLPMLFYVKRKWLSSGLLILCLFFILKAVKRGNIVAAALPAVLLVIYNFSEVKRNMFNCLVFLAIMFAACIYLKNTIIENDFFMYRIQQTLEGDSSGRDVIYTNAWNAWLDSSFIHSFVGNGYDSTLSLIGIHAHNDWLEILVDFGIIGCAIYLIIFIILYSNFIKSRVKLHRYVIVSCGSIWLLKSLISMAYISSFIMIMMIPLAIAITSRENQ